LRFELQRTAALNRGGSLQGETLEQSTTITQQQAEIQDLAARMVKLETLLAAKQ
jgi:hypothetical protein